MQFARYLKPETVRLGMMTGHVDGADPEKDEDKERRRLKEDVINELTDIFMLTGKIRNREKFYHDLLSRERKASTAIGGGLAIPHVRSMQPRDMCMIFARSRDGVEFLSPDGEPVHIIFGVAAPSYDERASMEFTKFYQWLARAFKEQPWISDSLLNAETPHEIIAILSGLD